MSFEAENQTTEIKFDDISVLYNFPHYKGVGDHYGAYAHKYMEIMKQIEFVDARLVAEYCKSLPQLAYLVGNKDAVVLDVACGTGDSGNELIKQGFIPTYGIDASLQMLCCCPDGIY